MPAVAVSLMRLQSKVAAPDDLSSNCNAILSMCYNPVVKTVKFVHLELRHQHLHENLDSHTNFLLANV